MPEEDIKEPGDENDDESDVEKSTSTTVEGRPLTFGEKAVGLIFNPSNDPQVTKIKVVYAHIIDELNDMKVSATSPDQMRLISIAITEAQGAQMWAVKAITWRD